MTMYYELIPSLIKLEIWTQTTLHHITGMCNDMGKVLYTSTVGQGLRIVANYILSLQSHSAFTGQYVSVRVCVCVH